MTMMQRAEAMAERRREQAVGRVGEALRAAFPDLAVERSPEGLAVTGRGLARRRISDARLRTIAAAEGVRW